MSISLSHSGQAPYDLTSPRSVAQAGNFFFLLFIFVLPFQRMTDNLFGIQGLKPFNVLSAVVLAQVVLYAAPLHATDKIERTSIRLLLLYFATLVVALARSIPNAPLLHSRFPDSFPDSYFSFLLSCSMPCFYLLPFLFVLKRMCSFPELEKITTVICLSILLLSFTFIALVLMNPSALHSADQADLAELVSANRNEMAELCDTYFGVHYNTIGTIYICTIPLLLYRALTRGAFWIVPFGLALVAILLLQSRSAMVIVAVSCALFLVLRRSYVILAVGAAAAGVASLLWTVPTVQALLSVGFDSGTDVSADALFTGRVDSVWIPLLNEAASDASLFLFGGGRYATGASQLWASGTLMPVTHAHNAIINFFIDCGAILTGVLLVFLAVGTVIALRVGRRLNIDLYWALFVCLFGLGISMATECDILPSIENMYVFPIIAMMINLARLRGSDTSAV